MRTILLQLERLRRNYELSVRTYDEVSLLELSHSLRIWTELRQSLPKIAPAFGTTLAFKTAIPAKKVMRAARGVPFVFSSMPGGVITYASKGELVAKLEDKELNSQWTVGCAFKTNADHSVELKNFSAVERVLELPMIKKVLTTEDQTRCNYAQWMAAEAVRTSYLAASGELKTVSISREMIVKRVANTMDGSHPSSASDTDGVENSFDEAVQHLLQYKMGGLPLPYFILLKIAQDILAVASKLLGVGAAGESR